MEHNLLKIETDYGDKDFIIEWDQIRDIFTGTYFHIYMTDGTLQYGWLRTSSDSTIDIISTKGDTNSFEQLEIIKLMAMSVIRLKNGIAEHI